MSGELAAACRRSLLADIVWREGDAIRWGTWPPLLLDETLMFALPYADASAAQSIAKAQRGAVAFTDARFTAPGWRASGWRMRLSVEPDPEGKRLTGTQLLEQLITKNPPSRELLDTPLRRREHWWFVPRLLVRAEPVGPSTPLEPRSLMDRHAVLAQGHELAVDTVEIDDWDAPAPKLRSLTGRAFDDEGETVALYAYDTVYPELNEVAWRRMSGRLTGDQLRPIAREQIGDLARRYSLRQRWRRHRALERACRQGLS